VVGVGRWGVVATLLVGCSFETASGASTSGTPGPADSSSSSGDEATSNLDTSATTTGSNPGATSDPDPSGPSGPSETDDTTPQPGDTGDATGETSGGIDIDIGCPDELPDAWVFCEDFEDIDDPDTHFARWEGPGLALEGPGYDSPTALEITHTANINWSGQAQIRFGQGPAANNIHAPGGLFDEVWVRFRTRVDEDWSIQGPGDVLSVDGVNGNPDALTFLARVTSAPTEDVLRSSAFSCVFYDSHPCTGVNDWNTLQYRGHGVGGTPVFGGPQSIDWTCVVLHARLNTANQADGVTEILVEEQVDSQISTIDFRGIRDDLGFNQVSIPTFNEDPSADDQRRYIDDVVVSTASLDCE